MEELAEWVNPEYLSPSMVDQCAAAFNDNGSTIQLHRFLKVRSGVSMGKAQLKQQANSCAIRANSIANKYPAQFCGIFFKNMGPLLKENASLTARDQRNAHRFPHLHKRTDRYPIYGFIELSIHCLLFPPPSVNGQR